MLYSLILVEFQHVGRSANGFADPLAKLGVDKLVPFVVNSLSCVFPFVLFCLV